MQPLARFQTSVVSNAIRGDRSSIQRDYETSKDGIAMKGWIVRMAGDALRCASTHRHPSAIAMAIAFGFAIGLIPKDNLLVLGMVGAMFFVRMNHALAISMIVAVSGTGFWTDGMTGRLGQFLLELPWLQAFWNKLASWPILPWFRWNNTVVLGGMVLSAASFVPAYAICILTLRHLARYWTQNRVDAMVSEIRDYHLHIQTDQRQRNFLDSDQPSEERRRTIENRGLFRHRIDTAPAAEIVKPKVIEARPEPVLAMMATELASQISSAVLQETVIEIVRYRPKGQSLPAQSEFVPTNAGEHTKPNSPTNPSTMDPTSTQALTTSSGRIPSRQASESESERTPTANAAIPPMVPENSPETVTEKPREEALRYLLWHLSGVHRKPRQQEPVT